MKTVFIAFILFMSVIEGSIAQRPPVNGSAEVYGMLRKLKVLGSVLYIAAHPDDENTRLLAWLAKERMYRTGYLSITRGDGGQNLIGDEQGIELGLIRTHELLAARRIDGAEQFFTRAYDFGFTKTTEEALATWQREKILSDVVWVIRRFQPDIIITRFPEDSRAGHGHHSGSGVLAHEAFQAAGDPARYTDQFRQGVGVWKARRIMWNTFNFGSTNTTSEEQLKIDVGGYNPVLGKGYGEIAAESRSQHKSQGFGVPASRGQQWEYFNPVEGDIAKKDIMDGVVTDWSRIDRTNTIEKMIDSLIASFSIADPAASLPGLLKLHQRILQLEPGYWRDRKKEELESLIESCSGLFMEAVSNAEYAVQGDSVRLLVTVNSRRLKGIALKSIHFNDVPDATVAQILPENRNVTFSRTLFVDTAYAISQPYWMVEKMAAGHYNVSDQQLIGEPQNPPSFQVVFEVEVGGQVFRYTKPVAYKFTDPVRGELYQPLVVVPPAAVSTDPNILVFRKGILREVPMNVKITAYRNIRDHIAHVTSLMKYHSSSTYDSAFTLSRGLSREYAFKVGNASMKDISEDHLQAFAGMQQGRNEWSAYLNLASIRYDHIPPIHYFYQDGVKLLNIDLKTAGKKIGYIEGAGDKVGMALQQMGYEVTFLKEKDLNNEYLQQFDAVVTGVRAYNVNEYLYEKYEILMHYVEQGGNLIVQYNTSNNLSNVRARIAPFPFSISRNRVTDEKSPVAFLLPDHPVLNFPNKITAADFEGWVQERGIYFADGLDQRYAAPLGMSDAGEQQQRGSLIIADHGKGKFVYTGLVFFRQLPAGIPGAFRLMANILALNNRKSF